MNFGRVADVEVRIASLHLVQLDKGSRELVINLLQLIVLLKHTERIMIDSLVHCLDLGNREPRVTIGVAMIILKAFLEDGRLLHCTLILHSKNARARVLRRLLHRCWDNYSVLAGNARSQARIQVCVSVP